MSSAIAKTLRESDVSKEVMQVPHDLQELQGCCAVSVSQAPRSARHQSVHAWYAQGKETTDNPCTNCNNGCTCGDVSASFGPCSEREIADAAMLCFSSRDASAW